MKVKRKKKTAEANTRNIDEKRIRKKSPQKK